ncbi:MAG: hypothetical protein FJ265_07980 [Planctomycetes bacterium]|nr:hypothetical protein [Planctomycetota bacterium]
MTTNQIQDLLRLLAEGDFGFPVAIHPGMDPELGAVIEADACDVPEPAAVDVSARLATILWPSGFAPTMVLPGVVSDFESPAFCGSLPAETVWYIPPRRCAHVPSR